MLLHISHFVDTLRADTDIILLINAIDLHYHHKIKIFFMKKTIDQFRFSSQKNMCAPWTQRD